MPVRTVLPDFILAVFYIILGGSHKQVKLGFHCICKCEIVELYV